VVRADGVYVSRFKTAELLRVDAAGNLASRFVPRQLSRMSDVTTTDPQTGEVNMVPTPQPVDPSVAWRTVASPDGSILMLHQYALAAVIHLPKPDDPAAPSTSPGPVIGPAPTQQQPYGAPVGGCGGLVQPGLSRLDPDGSLHMGPPLAAPVLGVDAAVSADGAWVAVAHAGTLDPGSPENAFGGRPSPGGQITIFDTKTNVADETTAQGCKSPTGMALDGQATAVAFNPNAAAGIETQTWIVAQLREPAELVLIRDPIGSQNVPIALGGESVADTGHDLFHRDAGAGIACASCHAEGAEDGRVWNFDTLGPRRTQAVHVGLEGTAPFHWDGDMTDFTKLMNEVLVRRMGGPPQSDARRAALETWLYSLKPPAPIVAQDDPAAVRGQALFTSAALGCTTCHAGERLTNNQNVWVGTTETGHLLQVPSLHGVGYRAPFLHDGRAATLADRFVPSIGGGDAHGHTSQLDYGQFRDLTAYLESL
jgi:hypothetical protein